MKLLVVTQTLDQNDPTLGFFHAWVEAFAKQFESVTVIALNVGATALPKNVTVHTLGKEVGMERGPRMFRYIALLVRLRDEYTHIFAHMNPEYVLGGGVIWRLLGKRIGFWYVHGMVSMRLKWAIMLSHKVFTASKESLRVKSDKVEVVGHGIDTELFSPRDIPHPPTISSIGRISPSKQLEIFIRTFAILKKESPLSAFLAGDAGTPEEKEYASRIKKEAETGGVEVILGVPHREVPALLGRSDAFFNASTTGSLDKAVLEAMSAGVVPVTSNVAFKDMLSPLGLFVESRPEAFAAAYRRLFADAARRKTLSGQVREEIVKNHSLTRLVGILRKAYEAL